MVQLLLFDRRGGILMKRIAQNDEGFTLIELMMVIAIVLVITSLSIFNLMGELPSYRLRSAAYKVSATLQYLKIRAVTTNRIAWFEANYATPNNHYFTGFVDEDGSGTASSSEYDATRLDLPDNVGGVDCFKLPPTISYGFPVGFTTSDTGPDGTAHPGAGNFITTYNAGGSSDGGYIGYRPTAVPVINPLANATPGTEMVIYLTNTLGEGYAVSVQITGRVRVWKWSSSGEWI
jgi:prepilin-type N-terminal cleavage/methylation domain-containing protein